MADMSRASGKTAASNTANKPGTAVPEAGKQDETPVGGPTQAEIDGAVKAREAQVNETTPAEAGNAVGQRMGEQDTTSQR